MRILLYEPGTAGHRKTIQRYVEKCMRRRGWEPVVCNQDYEAGRRSSLAPLLDHARSSRVDGIHVLTADGCVRRWVTDFSRIANRGVPILCTYYLYNNLYGLFSGAAWDALHLRGLADRVLISDDYINSRSLPRWRRNYLRFLPDPWDPEEFPLMDQRAARQALGLPEQSKIALLFGDLSPRKGICTVLDAADAMDKESTTVFLLAGTVVWGALPAGYPEKLRALMASGTVILREGFVGEEAVATHFFAADAVLCPYPSTFAVSSNTFTRGCAAGRPCLTAAHGTLGRMVGERNLGCVYPSEKHDAFLKTLQSLLGSPEYSLSNQDLAVRLRKVAEERTLERYGDHLNAVYLETFGGR